MMENNFPDDAYLHDPSTRKLDKWRSLFHMFNMTTLTVAFISLGVSLLTFYAAPAVTGSVPEYQLPIVYYGVNGVFMTSHAAFGAFSCVKGKLSFLKIYSIVGLGIVLEELAIGSWMVATLDNRIQAVIDRINELEDDHEVDHGHDDERKKRSPHVKNTISPQSLGNPLENSIIELHKRSEDEEEHHDEDHDEENEEDHDEDEEASKHSIYNDINEYYGCCMYAQMWLAENQPLDEIYEHCLTDTELFCGVHFIFFPGGDKARENIEKNCDCEVKVGAVITERIKKQTVLLFIALPSQILCLVAVSFFIKFEITCENNKAALSNYASSTQSKTNVLVNNERTSPETSKTKQI